MRFEDSTDSMPLFITLWVVYEVVVPPATLGQGAVLAVLLERMAKAPAEGVPSKATRPCLWFGHRSGTTRAVEHELRKPTAHEHEGAHCSALWLPRSDPLGILVGSSMRIGCAPMEAACARSNPQ